MKTEKYEEELQTQDKEDKRIDVESLDGRINFLVNTLEEYRRILEEDSEFNNDKAEGITHRFLYFVRIYMFVYLSDKAIENEEQFDSSKYNDSESKETSKSECYIVQNHNKVFDQESANSNEESSSLVKE